MLVARFRADHPTVGVRTIVVGSGEALELGRRGDVDVLIVHAPLAEQRFVDAGHAATRAPLMANDFVIVGPAADPAGARMARDPADALRRIGAAARAFVSRGDSSGTHERELALWSQVGATREGDWYLESGQGQATTLQIASERQAYAFTDRATFDALSDILDLEPLVERHPSLVNPYSVIIPVRAAHPDEAGILAAWLTSDGARAVIDGFSLPGDTVPLFRSAGPASATMGREAPDPVEPARETEDSVTSPVTGS